MYQMKQCNRTGKFALPVFLRASTTHQTLTTQITLVHRENSSGSGQQRTIDGIDRDVLDAHG